MNDDQQYRPGVMEYIKKAEELIAKKESHMKFMKS